MRETLLSFLVLAAIPANSHAEQEQVCTEAPEDTESNLSIQSTETIAGLRDIDYPPTPYNYCRELVYMPIIRLCLNRYLEDWDNCDQEYQRCRESTLYSPFYLCNCRAERRRCREITLEVDERCLKQARDALAACWDDYGRPEKAK